MTSPALAEVLTQAVLAQAETANTGAVSTGEAIAFWVLGPIALAGALGMVFAKNAVHSALWLVVTMLCLGALYMVQQAPFLGFTQIIVYTGAVMMLFLFVLMLVGRDSSDSVVEVLRGQRLAAAVLGIGFSVLLVGALAGALPVSADGLAEANGAPGGNVGGLGRLIFTEYLFPFELTSALLITAALGAMVLAFSQARNAAKKNQRQTVEARLRGEHARISPLPGPGVFATANSVATPALLPDGTVAPESMSDLLETVPAKTPAPLAPLDAHALTTGRENTGRENTGRENTGRENTGRENTGRGDTAREDTAPADAGEEAPK